MLGVAAGAVVAGATVQALAAPPSAAATTDPVLHLLRRATFGPTPALLASVKKVGANAWLDAQLKPSTVADKAMDSFLTRYPRLAWRTWEVRENDAGWDVMYDCLGAHTARHLWSNRQVLEVTVDFFTNHLVVPGPTSEVWDSLHLWQRDVIRKHALGKYSDMLVAAARHPAMLNVLDNANSSKKAPNENYGRELLELHTVGVGTYTEAEVLQSARILTGLSVDNESGMYEYKPQRHYVGRVKVLGFSHANATAEGGEAVAKAYLVYLARHPSTAKRLVTKLCVRFVADAPPASLVTKLTAVYLKGDTAIAPVLKALFTSPEFLASAGKKIKRPYEDAIATLRILGFRSDTTGTKSLGELHWATGVMGQAAMGWPAPDGYPDVAAAWAGASGTLMRWNFHAGTTAGWRFKTMRQPKLAAMLPATVPATYTALVSHLAGKLLLPPLSKAQIAAVCTFLEKAPTDVPKATDAALTWRLPYVVALLLDSPNFALR